MNQITLTDAGKEILTATNIGGVSQYWVGYFGLAYVPVKNTANPELDPDDADYDPGLKSLHTLIGPNEKGDYIYNIWQGDITGGGYADGTEFTGLTLYDSNLSSNFRYSYDENTGKNKLITWITDGVPTGSATGMTTETYNRIGYRVYEGCGVAETNTVSDTVTVEYTDSNIPVPAPLMYLGGELTYSHGDLSIMGNELGADWPMSSDGYPKVTPDMRCYSGKSVDSQLNNTDVIDSVKARELFESTGLIDNYNCFVSLSNFNKEHAQVSSEGYETDFQESCHNMSRVTKLFPIAKYEIQDADPETKETRTGNANTIKYTLELNFKGMNNVYRGTLNFSDKTPPENQLFKDNPYNSFKFNRIGIYAVPVSVRKFRKEGDYGCNHCQVEVEPAENPVLVAIISIDDVILSEDNSVGFSSWRQDFIFNLQHVDSDTVTAMVRDVEVYYNIAENEAITWYQNQLISSAGLSAAVTTLGVDVAYLKNRVEKSSGDTCGSVVSNETSQYADKNHTHDFIKNLVDAEGIGAVKGATSNSVTGDYSFNLGLGNSSSGAYSIMIGHNVVSDASYSISATSGPALTGDNSTESLLLSSSGASTSNVRQALIACSTVNIDDLENSLLLGDFNAEHIVPLEITKDEYDEAIDRANNATTLAPGWYCLLGSGGNIMAWDDDESALMEKPLTGGYTSGKFYGIQVAESDGRRIPYYKPEIHGAYAEATFMLPASQENIISLGKENGIAANSKNAVVIGSSNYFPYTKLTNTLILGDDVLSGSVDDRFGGNLDDGPIQLELSNVSVIGGLGSDVLDSLHYYKDLGTNNYSDTHIFLNSEYKYPEMFGIFSDPTNMGANFYGAYIPMTGHFDENDVYVTTTSSPDAWAYGLPRSTVHGLINSAKVAYNDGAKSVPMIYTGGICLAGRPNTPGVGNLGEFNAGRIKLGSGVMPSAYVTSVPLSNWFGGSNFIIPISITGTTVCPYGGLVLGITNHQEIDGTMHLGLYKLPTFDAVGLATEFTEVTISSDSPYATVSPETCYLFDSSFDGQAFLIPEENHDGDEFMVKFTAQGQSISFPSVTSNYNPPSESDIPDCAPETVKTPEFALSVCGFKTITADRPGDSVLMRQVSYKSGQNSYMGFVPVAMHTDDSPSMGVTRTFMYDTITDTGTYNVVGGRRYRCQSTCTLGITSSISDGDEFIVDLPTDDASATLTVSYPSIDQAGGVWPTSGTVCPTNQISRGVWLFRATSYITKADETTGARQTLRGFMAFPIGRWLPDKVYQIDDRVTALES